MPQAKKQYHVEIELCVGLPKVIDLKYTCDEVTVSSTPHETTSQPPACCLKQTASAVPVMPQPRRPDLHNYAQYGGFSLWTTNPTMPQPECVSSPTCPGTTVTRPNPWIVTSPPTCPGTTNTRPNPWVVTPPVTIMPPAAMYPVPGLFTEPCQRTMNPPIPPQFLMPPTQPVPSCPMQGTIVGGFGSCPPPPMVIRMGPPMPPAGPIVVIRQYKADSEMGGAANVCPMCTRASATPNPLIGTWHRKIGRCAAVITFTHDEMKMCLTRTEDEQKLVVTVTAQYTLTKEGLVYGAITGADLEDPEGRKMGKDDLDGDLDEIVLLLQSLADHPFSFRAKMTSAGLMVSNVKVAPPEEIDPEDFALLGGLYKQAKNGSLSCPLATKASNCGVAGCVFGATTSKPLLGAAIGGLAGSSGGALIGNPADKDLFVVPQPAMGQPLPPGGYSFPPPLNVAPPTMALPSCPMPQTVDPVGGCGFPNDPMKQMAADVFGQLLQQSDANRGGLTLPSPRYLKHYPQYFAPDPPFPLPRELASMEDPERNARRVGGPALGPVGTWYRDLGNRRCVLNIAGDHMTITVTEAYEENGKTVIGNLTFTADYHLTRDGVTAVGLITSVDMKFEGDLDEDEAKQMYDQLGEIQKKLEDKPIAMNLRMYGDSLVIGKVRIPSVEKMDTQPATYVAGRFTRVGDKPMPKLKVVKACEPKTVPPGFGGYGAPVLPAYGPTPAYGPPVPVYGPAVPPGAYDPQPLPGPYGSPVPVSEGLPPAPGYAVPPPGVPAPRYAVPPLVDENLPPQGLPPQPSPAPLARPMPYVPTPYPQAVVPSPATIPCKPNKVRGPQGEPVLVPRELNKVQVPPGEPVLPVSEDAPGMTEPPPPPTSQMPAPIPPSVSLNEPIQVTITPLDTKCPGAILGSCEVVTAKSSIQGTWYRELGPMLCVLKIDADHITVTAYMVGRLEDGTDVKEGLVITADYHVSRNGTSVIGQITSVDMLLEGDIPDVGNLTDGVRDLQKTLMDQLFSANFRLYGDTLVLGALRLPGLGEKMSEGQMLMLGRYKNLGDKPLPKPKPVKEKRVGRGDSSTPTAPLGAYGGQPVPIPSGSIEYAVPLNAIPAVSPATVPSMPEPSANPAVSPAIVPSMPEPTPLVPQKQMSQPTPPTLGQLNSSDPNIRMSQLLDQSEDTRPIQNQWRRFWFNDQPTHLTPERIHGGIY